MSSALALMLVGMLAEAAPCENLKSLSLPNTTVVSAQLVAAGAFTPPPVQGPPGGPVVAGNTPAPAGARGGNAGPAAAGRGAGGRGGAPAAPAAILPEHCRVALLLTPSPDSHIDMEVWMPANNWNGKFQAVGNGGWAGTISYPAMATALQEGYATASNDTGHKGGNALFAIDHPEKLVDFAYRAVHEMTVQSKAVINSYYKRAPRLSYWNGCSTGGRQGLMSAQKYPDDFDGIIAGAPANFQTHLHAWDLSVAVPVLTNPAAAVPASKLQLVNDAVINACDARDGVADGLLNDPRACTFDVASLQCKAGDADSCLTAPQVESMKRMYAPARTSSGEIVFPGKDPGSETGWGGAIGGGQQPNAVPIGSFLVAYNDANWDWRGFNLDRDLTVDRREGGHDRQCRQPRSARLQGARRQAPHVSRLERHRDLRRQCHQLLQQRAAAHGTQPGRLDAPVHGAGDAALRRRPGTQSGQLDGRARAVARVG